MLQFPDRTQVRPDKVPQLMMEPARVQNGVLPGSKYGSNGFLKQGFDDTVGDITLREK